jgi:hypothetical protein
MKFIYLYRDVELELPLSLGEKNIEENLLELEVSFQDYIKQSKLFSVFKIAERYGE